jgi:hypothetical protein
MTPTDAPDADLRAPEEALPHVLPATSSDERSHVLAVDCWCEPTIESVAPGHRAVAHQCGHEQPCERHPL